VTHVLRREARSPTRRLTAPFVAVAAGVATIAGGLALFLASAPDVVVRDTTRLVPMPVLVPRLVVVPVHTLEPARIAARIDHVAASSGAPVIALAAKDAVWISRDDGASFARALVHDGEVTELFADADGNVYANRSGVLGVAARDGVERWSELPHLDGELLAAVTSRTGAVAVVAEQWGVGTVGAWAGDRAYQTLVPGDVWNALAVALPSPNEGRLLVSQRTGEHAWSAPELHVGDHVVWRGRYDDRPDLPRTSTPCAGITGDTLWIVQRDPDPVSTTSLSSRLLVVDAAGKERRVALPGVDLEAARVTCTIAGNPGGAYVSFAIDGHDARLYELDAARGVATFLDGGDVLDLRAVDHAGRALGLADGKLVRRAPDGTFTTLARP
jgi:hypothetical protein